MFLQLGGSGSSGLGQVGLGLTRQQWENDFRAFNADQTTLATPSNLPWMDFNPADWTFSSDELPPELWAGWTVVPDDQRGSHPGYVPEMNCYGWTFRPPDVADTVLFGVRGLHGGLGGLPAPFRVCKWRLDQPCPPGAPCPPAPACPPSQPCPPAPSRECPTCPKAALAPVKFGVNIGLLVAGVLTTGVGYYGYKKGWFKRLGIGK